MDKRDGHAYLSGVLLVMTRNLLRRVERCEQHDPWLVNRDREQMDRIDQVINAPGWSEEDIRAIVAERVPA